MIVYDPSKLLKKIAPESKIKKLLSKSLTVKKAALSFVDSVDFIDKKSVSRVALNVVKSYKDRIATAREDSAALGKEVREEILDDPKLLISRIENEVVTQIGSEIKNSYSGEQYEWLPSDAETPDPEHQLNYGKIFTVGEGEMPGDRYGCRCGMNILVKGSKLELG